MRAFQIVEFGAPLVSRDLSDPTPDGDAVIVEVLRCGLCHSDVHIQQGHIGLGGDQRLPVTALGINAPATLGHEIFGRIAAFGPSSGLHPADVGRLVIVYPWIGCGRGAACLAGRDNECPKPEGPIGLIGMGALRLMALSIAKGTGLGPVAAPDIRPAKLALAQQVGR